MVVGPAISAVGSGSDVSCGMAVTGVTRRALTRELVARGHWWWGDLDEVDFLRRLYDLEDLASHDDRYPHALADFIQHRINNFDWDDDWIFDDVRFRLNDTDDDVPFLRFLAETVNPEVRTDREAVQTIVAMYNDHLRHDGLELYHESTISGRPVFGWRQVSKPSITRRQIRESIAEAIRDNLKSYDVAEFCEEELGLDPPRDQYDDPHSSKRAYVLERLKSKSEPELLVIARRVLREFDDASLASVVAAFDASDVTKAHGTLKNLIFAADGPKPEIVLRDAVNNDIEITANSEYCLVYDRPLDDTGLTWRKLVAWWGEAHPGDDERAVALDLHRRLSSGLNGAERLVLNTYARLYRDYGFDLPALIPQVYLHYDPYSRRQRLSAGPLARQRMDFLVLLPRHKRVVVELDGVQHYADEKGQASPSLYAEMVREDRRLQLAGYDVFRIGGNEVADRATGERLLREFFESLLRFHDITLEATGTRS